MIKRTLYTVLKNHLAQKEITLITGPRQAGKTTLMLKLKQDLEKKKKPSLFFNLDIETDKQYFDSQKKLLTKIELEIGDRGYVFIDEIQRKENAGIFLKGIFDMGLSYKFIVSGSGSLELKEKIHESLAGRKQVFPLSTLTFLEFLDFKTGYQYENKIKEFLSLELKKTLDLLEEYLIFGGYPRVVLAQKKDQKLQLINEIYQSFLEKDIVYLLQVKKTEKFSQLVRLMAGQVANLVNYSKLAATLGLSTKTIKNYLWYLEKTFILIKSTPYFSNLRKEISKAPIYYFNDLGLRNFSLGIFGSSHNLQDRGWLFQNFVFNLLKAKLRSSAAKINFWRTKDGAEVDLIINQGKQIIACEVKHQFLQQPKMTRGLQSFIKKYQPAKVLVVNLSLNQTVSINKTKVSFMSFDKLLFFSFS